MHPTYRRLTLSCSILLLAGFALSVGCSHPPTSRSGAVRDIRVVEGPEPADLIVNVGDEVRWVNARTLPVRIDLVGVKHDDVLCERGFSNLLGTLQESATINANETAAICFAKGGVVNYNIRMESALPGGKDIVSGLIRVGTMGR